MKETLEKPLRLKSEPRSPLLLDVNLPRDDGSRISPPYSLSRFLNLAFVSVVT